MRRSGAIPSRFTPTRRSSRLPNSATDTICCAAISRAKDPAVLWPRYVQLTQIESVFRSLKSELGVRPIYHQLEHRADAHVLVAFLAYCLQVTLKNRLMIHAPGLTPAAVFEKLATIQMVEVWIPLRDGRWLVLPRHTQPEPDVQAVLNQCQITLPCQPPPRIKASHIATVDQPQPAG